MVWRCTWMIWICHHPFCSFCWMTSPCSLDCPCSSFVEQMKENRLVNMSLGLLLLLLLSLSRDNTLERNLAWHLERSQVQTEPEPTRAPMLPSFGPSANYSPSCCSSIFLVVAVSAVFQQQYSHSCGRARERIDIFLTLISCGYHTHKLCI